MSQAYQAFLRAKVAASEESGLACSPEEVHPLLKPHQRDIVAWAVRGGRRAVFAAFGLGKTMTAQDVLEGRMIVEIGIAAVRPAEFIVLKFFHKLPEA